MEVGPIIDRLCNIFTQLALERGLAWEQHQYVNVGWARELKSWYIWGGSGDHGVDGGANRQRAYPRGAATQARLSASLDE